jgi:hypothetical protein
MHDDTIPGRASVADWEHPPMCPLRVTSFGAWRDGWGTPYFVLQDAVGREFAFFFDGHLGRLCAGRGTHVDDDAAFVKKGSRLMADVLDVLVAERAHGTQAGLALASAIDKAIVYSGLGSFMAPG